MITIEDFEKRIEKYQKGAEILKKQCSNLSALRTALGLAVVLLWVWGGFFVASPAIICFVFLIVMHKKKKILLAKTLYKVEINQKYIARKNGNWRKFKITGEEFVNKEHPYSYDLDIFGKNSLFQYINEANTYYGRELLSNLLTPEELDKPTILMRQTAIKELSKKRDFCEDIKCEGGENIGDNPKKLIDFLEREDTLFKWKGMKYILSALPVITIGMIFINIQLFIALFSVQVLIFIGFALKTSYILSSVYKFDKSISSFKSIISLLTEEKFDAELNKQMQEILQDGAAKTTKSLRVISEFVNLRRSMLVFVGMNVFFLYDLQLVFALEELRENGGRNIKKWLRTVGFFEALISLTVLPDLEPTWAYPTLNAKNEINVQELSHPLLGQGRVHNDFDLQNIVIISGSNMSGKTTFMRSLGVNLVLAYAGSVVCAKEFDAPLLDIYTSMRIEDDLSQGMSTFYAELVKIKKIIDNSKRTDPMIFLIDEIFRGTNSIDRVDGAKMVLNQLTTPHILGIITTHDLEVCTPNYNNYHFSEHYVEESIRFDYKMKKGVSTTRNAKHLMKMIGIN